MAVKKIIYTIEVQGTEQQVRKLNEIEKELYDITKARNALITKQRKGNELTKQEEQELTSLTAKQKELSAARTRQNQEISRTINYNNSNINTLRGVNAELAVLRNKIQDVVIGSREYQQIGKRIKDLESKQRDYNREIGRGTTFVGEYARGAINAFGRVGVAAASVMAAWGAVSGTIGKSLNIYKQAERAEMLLSAAIRNRGETTQLTTDQLLENASALSKLGSAGRTDILKGITTQLLTFRNISDEIFSDVQKTVLDVATVLSPDGNLDFGQLKTAAIQLGKALNEPGQALSALTRSGIQFSVQQKEMIKDLFASGEMLEAQKLILQEVNKQYGTAYEQTGKGAGQFQMIAKAIKGFQKEVGSIISEYFAPIAGRVTDLIRDLTKWFSANREGIIKTVKAVGILTGGYVAYRTVLFTINKAKQISLALTTAWTTAKNLFNKSVWIAVTATKAETVATEGATVAQKGLNTAMRANPIGLVIGLVTTLITVLALLPKKVNAAVKAQNELNDAMVEGKQSVEEQRVSLTNLMKIAGDETQSLNARQEAVRQLNNLMPEFNNNLTLEAIKSGEAKKAVDQHVQSLVLQAQATALVSKISEANNKLMDESTLKEENRLTFWQRMRVLSVQTTGDLKSAEELRQAYLRKNLTQTKADLISLSDTLTKQLTEITKKQFDVNNQTTKTVKTQAEITRTLLSYDVDYLEQLKSDLEEGLDFEGMEELEGVTSDMLDKIIAKKKSTEEKSKDLTKDKAREVLDMESKLHERLLENITNAASKELAAETLRHDNELRTYQDMIIKKQKLSDEDILHNQQVNELTEQENLAHVLKMQDINSKYNLNDALQLKIDQERDLYEQGVNDFQTYIKNITELVEQAQLLKTVQNIYKMELDKINQYVADAIEAEDTRWEKQVLTLDEGSAKYQAALIRHNENVASLNQAVQIAQAMKVPFEMEEEEEIPDAELDAILSLEQQKLDLYKEFQDKGIEVLRGTMSQKQELLTYWYKAGLISEKQYQKLITDMTKSASEGRKAILIAGLQGLVQIFGESSKIGRAAVIAEQAYAVAEATIALIKGTAKSAGAAPFPANLVLIAGFISATAGLIAKIKAVKTPEIESPKVRVSGYALGKSPDEKRGKIIQGQGGERSDTIPAMVSPGEAVINALSMKDQDVLTITGTPKQIASEINSYKGYGIRFAAGKAPVMTAPTKIIKNDTVSQDLIRNIVRETVAGIVNIPVVVSEREMTYKQRMVQIVETQGDF